MRRGPRTGLRVRIAVTIAGIVVLAVGALGVAVHFLVLETRVSNARSAADQRIQAAQEIYANTGLLSFDARVGDPRAPEKLRDAVPSDGDRATLVSGGSTRVLWSAGRTGDTVLTRRTTFHAADASVKAVDRALLLAGGVTAVTAAMVGLLSARRLARRLGLAARTARAVAEDRDRSSLREAVGGGRDEVARLADAVDAMALRLAERVEVEQRFTADVAHDLRTPVTGLVTAAALLEDSRAAELVRDRAGALGGLVEELLEVARLDGGLETASLEHVDVAEVVDRAVRHGVEAGEYDGDSLVVRTDPGEVLLTDARRLERVLSNLIRNAGEHGAPPIEIHQTGARVVVRDHGTGFDHALLAEGPRRLRQSGGGAGNGLGLVIAAGQAAVLGARLSFANASDGGAVATLDLPERAITAGDRDAGLDDAGLDRGTTGSQNRAGDGPAR